MMCQRQAKSRDPVSNPRSETPNLKSALCICVALTVLLTACDVERRKSDAELGLNPQQVAGRQIYDQHCDRCHAPYSSSGKQGPSMKGVFKKPFLEVSGLPANDERVADIIRYGRSKMPGFGQVLSPKQVEDLLVYMHTL